MAEGRISIQWFNVFQYDESYKQETLYIGDYLDEQKLKDSYPNQSLRDNCGLVISEKATIVCVSRHLYQSHYRNSELLSKNHLNHLIYNSTPNLKDYGLSFKKRVVKGFTLIRCRRGQILETEGELSRCAYIVVKGRLKYYKKIINDEINDSNKKRKERRAII